MAEKDSGTPSSSTGDEGIDKQAVLDEIAKASQSPPAAAPVPTPAPAASVASPATPPAAPVPDAPTPAQQSQGKTGESAGPAPDERRSGHGAPPQRKPSRSREPEEKATAPQGPAVPVGLWEDLYLHRRVIAISICLSIGVLWFVLGAVSGKIIPFILAAVFLVPTLINLLSPARSSDSPQNPEKH